MTEFPLCFITHVGQEVYVGAVLKDFSITVLECWKTGFFKGVNQRCSNGVVSNDDLISVCVFRERGSLRYPAQFRSGLRTGAHDSPRFLRGSEVAEICRIAAMIFPGKRWAITAFGND